MGGNATSPLRSWGSPTRGSPSDLATSPLPSQVPPSWRNCYITPALSGLTNKGDKIRMGYPTLAFSEAHRWLEPYHHPCVLGGPPQKGGEMTIGYLIPSPSWGPTCGRSCYVWPSWGPRSGQNCCVTPAFSAIPNRGTNLKLATSSLTSRGPTSWQNCYITPALSWSEQGQQIQNWLPHPCLLGVHKFSPVPDKGGKLRPGYFTPAFSVVRNKGDKIRIGYLITLPSRGPTSGRTY